MFLLKKNKIDKEKLIKINYNLKKTQENFLQNMSHEFRTPLTAMMGYTDLLMTRFGENNFDAKCLNTLHLIKKNENYLSDRINLVLNYSKLKSGSQVFDAIEVKSISQVVESIVSAFVEECEIKKIKLTLNIQTDIVDQLQIHFQSVEFILEQIILNAVKFTAHGEIKIQVSQDRILQKINIQIFDTGCGIEEKNIKNIFKPFYQVESSSARQRQGLGLGLAVCQLMARQINADLTVESEIRRGSVFKFSVPYSEKPVFIKENIKLDFKNLKTLANTKKIILAEDNPDNRLVIKSFLQKVNIKLSVVENGHEAVVQILMAEKEKDPFDLVLMDMQMPIMDGFQATRMLRQRGFSRPILAVTAHNLIGDREKCIAAGCTDYLTKPVQCSVFLKTINSYLEMAI